MSRTRRALACVTLGTTLGLLAARQGLPVPKRQADEKPTPGREAPAGWAGDAPVPLCCEVGADVGRAALSGATGRASRDGFNPADVVEGRAGRPPSPGGRAP